MRYFVRFNSDREPVNLYRFHQDIHPGVRLKMLSFDEGFAGTVLEESWNEMGWDTVFGTVKRILEGYIDCDEVTEAEARKIYPEAFANS